MIKVFDTTVTKDTNVGFRAKNITKRDINMGLKQLKGRILVAENELTSGPLSPLMRDEINIKFEKIEEEVANLKQKTMHSVMNAIKNALKQQDITGLYLGLGEVENKISKKSFNKVV